MKDIKSILKFHNYKVDKVNFEMNNKEPDSTEYEVNFKVRADFSINDDNTKMLVTLKTSLYEDEEDNYPFKMFVAVTGLFSTEADGDIVKFKANAAAILFPYVRALVSSFTANCNVVPLILPTINIHKMLTDDETK